MGRRRHRKAARQRQVSELLTPDAEPDFLYLTTTGRRTGRAREIEIWFTELPAHEPPEPSRRRECGTAAARQARFYVIAEHGERAGWVRNLRANAVVYVRVGTRRVAGRARVVPTAESALCGEVRARMTAKYGWGDGLVVEITPEG